MTQQTLPFAETHVCVDCGTTIVPDGFSTGYAIRSSKNVLDKEPGEICYSCCARDDESSMRKLGHSYNLPLYLSKNQNGWYVSNWPGTLRFRVYHIAFGKHNIAGTRKDVWFRDSDNREWHGVNYGENSQIVHCRRLK